jgi:hypothetical protein
MANFKFKFLRAPASKNTPMLGNIGARIIPNAFRYRAAGLADSQRIKFNLKKITSPNKSPFFQKRGSRHLRWVKVEIMKLVFMVLIYLSIAGPSELIPDGLEKEVKLVFQ